MLRFELESREVRLYLLHKYVKVYLMEDHKWQQVWLASEAVKIAEEFAVSGRAIPTSIEQQFIDNIEAVDIAHHELFPRFEKLPDQPAASTALYDVLLSSQTGETVSNICLRALSKLSNGPESKAILEDVIDPGITEAPSSLVEQELLFRMHTDDKDELIKAQTEIIEKYGKFVYMKARNLYNRSPKKAGVDYDDLAQEGLLGLLYAAKLYRPDDSSGAKFLSYAVYHIEWSMFRFYSEARSAVKLPVHIRQKIIKFESLNNYRWDHGQSRLKVDEVARITDVLPTLDVARDRNHTTVGNLLEAERLCDYMGSLENGFSAHNMGPSNNYVIDERVALESLTDMNEKLSVEDQATRSHLQATILDALTTLSVREAEILSLHFGLHGKVHTLKEISKVYGVTKERIRNIEMEALAKLRRSSISENLRDFL